MKKLSKKYEPISMKIQKNTALIGFANYLGPKSTA